MAISKTPDQNYSVETDNKISVAKFVDSNLKLYSAHSNVRGIPFIGDGFKQAQRKALYGMMCRGENADKDTVERISAKSCSDTDYHHGSGSMEGTIVGLAQCFAGSNNINLIEPFGQFGNRLSKKPASSRYIKAKLSPNFRKLFKKEDDLILDHHYSNGDKIEPKYFIPLLPMPLVNGAEGMGTGHATYIMTYNPNELKSAILQILKGKKLNHGSLSPWFNGFNGTVERSPDSNQVIIKGKLEEIGGLSFKISELPIGMENDKYEAILHKLIDTDFIKSFVNNSDEQNFDIDIIAPRATTSLDIDELMKQLKLISRETENLTLWDTNGVIKKYTNVEEIIEEFVEWRLNRYEDRRQALIKVTEEDIVWIDERIRFIEFYLNNTQLFKNSGKVELLKLLEDNDFLNGEKLLSMTIWSLTKDKIDELNDQLIKQLQRLEQLNNDTPKKMYERELNELKF